VAVGVLARVLLRGRRRGSVKAAGAGGWRRGW
jgi:hypothetical protein